MYCKNKISIIKRAFKSKSQNFNHEIKQIVICFFSNRKFRKRQTFIKIVFRIRKFWKNLSLMSTTKIFFSLKHRSLNLFFNCFSIKYLRRFHFNYKIQKNFVLIFIIIWHVVNDCRNFLIRNEFIIFSCRNWIICAFVVFFEYNNLQKYTLIEIFKKFRKKKRIVFQIFFSKFHFYDSLFVVIIINHYFIIENW